MSLGLIFGLYMLIGLVVDRGIVAIVWGIVLRLCRGNSYKYWTTYSKYRQRRWDYTGDYPKWIKVIIGMILWPLNVVNTFKCGIPAIRELKEAKNDKDS